MLISLILLAFITLGGTVLTYIYEAEDSLLARLCAGNVIGSAIFSLAAFLFACLLGFSATTVFAALFVALLPLFLLIKPARRRRFAADVEKARENAGYLNSAKILNFAFYAALLLLFYYFFERAMLVTPAGIYTGGSQNLGDLPFHLGAIFSFSEGNNFPPENPSYAFAKFTYPFMTDLATACFVELGASVRGAMLVQNVTLAFALVVLLEKFVFALTRNRLAGRVAPVILLFSGGLGFIIFLRDYWHDGRGFFEFVWNLPMPDYTIRPKSIRWGNSLTTLFMTQRSLLLGMPLTLIVLTYLWKIFTAETPERGEGKQRNEKEMNFIPASPRLSVSASLFLGLLAGTLPLVHVHSLAVLFVVCAFLFFFRLDKWREWLAFGVGVSIIAVPQLIWVMTGSATNLKEFVGWKFGWDAQGENIFVFWAKNLGVFIPLLLLGIYLSFQTTSENNENENPEPASVRSVPRAFRVPHPASLLLFYLPFAFIFLVANLFKLAPWEWDNIKVLIYWFVASIPFVAWILAYFWEKGVIFKIAVAACLLILTFSGALDVWRVVSKQINYEVFNRDAVAIAEQIKQRTAPNALFLNAPTYNSAVVLSGRRSLMRYIGNLSSYGIDYRERENELQRIYEGSALAESFLRKNKIEYVLIGPEERSNEYLNIDEAYFARFPIVAEAGQYRVYKIK